MGKCGGPVRSPLLSDFLHGPSFVLLSSSYFHCLNLSDAWVPVHLPSSHGYSPHPATQHLRARLCPGRTPAGAAPSQQPDRKLAVLGSWLNGWGPRKSRPLQSSGQSKKLPRHKSNPQPRKSRSVGSAGHLPRRQPVPWRGHQSSKGMNPTVSHHSQVICVSSLRVTESCNFSKKKTNKT